MIVLPAAKWRIRCSSTNSKAERLRAGSPLPKQWSKTLAKYGFKQRVFKP